MKRNGEYVVCETCGCSLYRIPARLKRYSHQFCGFKCKGQWKTQQILSRHPKEDIEFLYLSQMLSIREMGKQLKLNNRTIAKLLNIYQIPKRYGSESIKNQWHNNGERRTSQAKQFVKNTANQRIPSETEQLFIDILTRLSIAFEFQYPIETFLLDFAIPSLKLNIEIDGKEHRLKTMRKKDSERDSLLRNEGWAIFRFTTTQIKNTPHQITRFMEQIILSLPQNT